MKYKGFQKIDPILKQCIYKFEYLFETPRAHCQLLQDTRMQLVQGTHVYVTHTDVSCTYLFSTKPQENPLNPANVNSVFTLLGEKQICHRNPRGDRRQRRFLS